MKLLEEFYMIVYFLIGIIFTVVALVEYGSLQAQGGLLSGSQTQLIATLLHYKHRVVTGQY